VIQSAQLKLTNAKIFNPRDKIHVLAVLSQRICLDLVPATAEAMELAEQSVAAHMRHFTGVAEEGPIFYTYSPSEPVLVLGAVELLYQQPHYWAQVLDTFNAHLAWLRRVSLVNLLPGSSSWLPVT
jgi:hypothetical protein